MMMINGRLLSSTDIAKRSQAQNCMPLPVRIPNSCNMEKIRVLALVHGEKSLTICNVKPLKTQNQRGKTSCSPDAQ